MDTRTSPATGRSKRRSRGRSDYDLCTDWLGDDGGLPGESNSFLAAAISVLDTLTSGCRDALRDPQSTDTCALNTTQQAFRAVARICCEAGVYVADVPLHDNVGSARDRSGVPTTPSPMRQDTAALLRPTGFECSVTSCVDSWRSRPIFEDEESNQAFPDSIDNPDVWHFQPTVLDFDTAESSHPNAGDSHDLSNDGHSPTHLGWQVRALTKQVEQSNASVTYVKEQLAAATERIVQLEETVLSTKRGVEHTIQDQSRYWRQVCDELLRDKRHMATQLAEERGRFSALKQHLFMHDTADGLPTSISSTSTPVSETTAALDEHDISLRTARSPASVFPPVSPARREDHCFSACRSLHSSSTRSNSGAGEPTAADSSTPSFRSNYLSAREQRQPHPPHR